MPIVLLNILFRIIIIDFLIGLLNKFNMLLILINKFLKLIKLIPNKLIDSAEN